MHHISYIIYSIFYIIYLIAPRIPPGQKGRLELILASKMRPGGPKVGLGRVTLRSKIALGRLLGAEKSLLGGSWAFKSSKRTPENFFFPLRGGKSRPERAEIIKNTR